MTDLELAKWLCIDAETLWQQMIAAIPPEKRALYEQLWQAGLGPKPSGVIVCREHPIKA